MADEPEITPATTETPAVETKTNHVLETSADAPDPDQAELDAALAEVEAEGKTAPVTDNPPADPVTTETGAVETPAATPAEAQQAPLAATMDERRRRQDAEKVARDNAARALYWKGVADGRLPAPKGATEVVHDPVADESRNIRSRQKELAKQVDEGTLSTEEYEDQRQKLEDRLLEIRDDNILAKAKAAAPDSSKDLYLQTLTDDLSNKHKAWLDNVPTKDLLRLVPFAKDELAAAGVDFAALEDTPLGDFRLREAVIATAIKFGFDELYKSATPTAAPASTAPVARPTKEQLDEKTKLAAGAPPAPVGATAPVNTWTNERVESMDSLDLENMSMADLKRVGETLDRDAASTRVHAPTRR